MRERLLRPKGGTQDERGIIMATKMVRNQRKNSILEREIKATKWLGTKGPKMREREREREREGLRAAKNLLLPNLTYKY
jgi:hypothetical protein